eukprot:5362748-Amphidinium_carterae.1
MMLAGGRQLNKNMGANMNEEASAPSVQMQQVKKMVLMNYEYDFCINVFRISHFSHMRRLEQLENIVRLS